MEHITSVDVFDQWKNCYSAMYEKTYFVTEFLNFRNSYESIREASWFLEFDTKMAKRAIYDYHDLHVAENLSSPYWRYRYTDLYERIRENLGLYYLTGGHSEDYLYVFGFKIVKNSFTKNLLSKNPSLFIFDLYRLGYFCQINSR